jgi:hypothetical protein
MSDQDITPPAGVRCDVFGCGSPATIRTSGAEVDALGRKAQPRVYVCEHHRNWPHSDDAAIWALINKSTHAARG